MNDREWRPLFSERLAMDNMGPLHRRMHVWFSRFHWRVMWALWPSYERSPSRLLRPWQWIWAQYRRTWKIESRLIVPEPRR